MITNARSRRYAIGLSLLFGLFAFRVVAQPLALVSRTALLPSFQSWHSGALPYKLLLASQIAILVVLGSTVWQFAVGHVTPRRTEGVAALVFGSLYFSVMVGRLILGMTVLSHRRWFASPIPTVFHLVLATFALLYGHFHYAGAAESRAADKSDMSKQSHGVLPYLIYPAVMTTTFVLFALFRTMGVPLVMSTYAPVLIAAGIVTMLELNFPHRSEWRPPVSEVKTDLEFMTIVQLAFPPLVGFVFTLALIAPARALHLPIAALWPHAWPIWLQALLMVLVVDFLRYWLHRAAHQSDTLWRLHSVHHSVEQMYWLNTARFHLLEKAMQMTLDSLPFLLMAVEPAVLSLYYVAYATNGFFQHCNIELRYGVLNYVVGSAETHRWHHSRIPRESNANYGNTVIVWDVVFGTWFLPRERAVEQLGLQDAEYPKSFLALMRAPFSR